MEIKFTVPGPPKGKQRPRVCRINGRSVTYTPRQTIEYEKLVRTSAVAEIKNFEQRREPCCDAIRASYTAVSKVKFSKGIPLEIRITALFSLPKTLSKKFSGKVSLPSREQSLLEQKEMLSRDKGSVAGGLPEIFKQSDCATCATARWPTKKPDADNIIKIILDVLNGIAYHDDAQICRVYFQKRYGGIPKIEVIIKNL